MPNNLTKAEKKLCRVLIAKGLEQEFEKSMQGVAAVIEDWKNKKLDNREAYQAIYKTVKDNDKHIAQRYDAISGSQYLDRIAGIAADGLISEDDIAGFSEESKLYLNRFFSVRNL